MQGKFQQTEGQQQSFCAITHLAALIAGGLCMLFLSSVHVAKEQSLPAQRHRGRLMLYIMIVPKF